MNTITLLVVDDEHDMRTGLKRTIAKRFPRLRVLDADSAEKALLTAQSTQIDLALLDIKMGGMSGIELLPRLQEINPLITPIMLTGFATIELAVESVKQGAYDFISKPFERSNLFRVIEKAIERYQLVLENYNLRQQIHLNQNETEFIGSSPAIRQLLSQITTISRTRYTTLVRGESGTGKELVARAIHKLSKRKDKPFIVVNCPAIPEHLLESELFGHTKGAFTGAAQNHRGLFQEAHGGTICLDEIGDLPINIQSKLLRVLQEGEIKPLGATATQSINVRVIALTHLNLEQMIQDKLFREDLFYRLNVVTITTPKLVSIKEDIPQLIHHFAVKAAKELDISPKIFSPHAIQLLSMRQWPGNVRELQNCVRRLIMFSTEETITSEEIALIENINTEPPAQEYSLLCESNTLPKYKEAKEKTLHVFTTQYLSRLFKETDGNITKGAEYSGISRAALQNIIKRYNINKDTLC